MIGKTALSTVSLSTVSLTGIALAATLLATPAAPAAASAAPAASAASAVNPLPVTSCGTTISGDAYLPHDLACAGGTGVTVTDSGTLNLRGHRLIGPGRSAAGFGTSVGVELATPQEAAAVRVRNGTLTGWDTAVQMFDTGPVRADRLVVKHGRVGFDAIGGAVTIVHSRLVDLGSGVTSLFGAVTVRRSAVSGSGQGVNVSQARATVEHSLIRGNQNGVNCGEAACVVTDSALLGNEFGVFLYNFGSVQMRDDVVAGNTTGVLAGDAGNTNVADIST